MKRSSMCRALRVTLFGANTSDCKTNTRTRFTLAWLILNTDGVKASPLCEKGDHREMLCWQRQLFLQSKIRASPCYDVVRTIHPEQPSVLKNKKANGFPFAFRVSDWNPLSSGSAPAYTGLRAARRGIRPAPWW